MTILCVCVFFPFILDIKFVGRTSRDHITYLYICILHIYVHTYGMAIDITYVLSKIQQKILFDEV